MSAEEKPEAPNPQSDSSDSVNAQGLHDQGPHDQGPDAQDTTAEQAQAKTAPADEPTADAVAGVAELVDANPSGDASEASLGESPVGEVSSEGITEGNLDTESTALEAELAAARAKVDEHWERILRMQADMENQRKRAQRDVESARKFALEGMINDLLPIKDSLEMGIAAARETDADASKIIEGSDLTLKMLSQAFEKYNISEVDPADEKFDPELHQAMSMQEVEGKESNTVTGVLQKGYTLNGRLLRPALVMVAK